MQRYLTKARGVGGWSLLVLAGLALAGLMPTAGLAATKTWTASGTNDWWTDGNWSPSGAPHAGDDVVITNAGVGVLLTNTAPASGWLSSLTISNATAPGASLIFSNWTTALSATNVTIKTNATLTCAGPFTNAPAMSNRVWLVCSNLTIETGGKINVDYMGYAGGLMGNTIGNGPGGGISGGGTATGAGYGGRAGGTYGVGGAPYGSATAPLAPGSGGGGSTWYNGGAGGGAVRIQANGTVTLNGLISANGDDRFASLGQYGGGSGGAIYVDCHTLAGAGGLIQANGGSGLSYGAGGGGRIAIYYDAASQRTSSVPNVTLSTACTLIPAATYVTRSVGYKAPFTQPDMGTVALPDSRLLEGAAVTHIGQICLTNQTSWSPNSLTISNGWVRFQPDDFPLSVTQDLTIAGSAGRLDLAGSAYVVSNGYYYTYATARPTLAVGGNLTLTNGGSLCVFSAVANSGTEDYGASINVTGDVTLATGAWIYPYAHFTNGGAPLFRLKNLTCATNAGINADVKGFMGGYFTNFSARGPGTGGANKTGGGYGGRGGDSWASGAGGEYGDLRAPLYPGSGAGSAPWAGCWGGGGGGLVRIEASSNIVLTSVSVILRSSIRRSKCPLISISHCHHSGQPRFSFIMTAPYPRWSS